MVSIPLNRINKKKSPFITVIPKNLESKLLNNSLFMLFILMVKKSIELGFEMQ
jgi:hypothetical protein